MAKTEGMRCTRRNFIKGAAVIGATGMLAGCSPVKDNVEPAEDSSAVEDAAATTSQAEEAPAVEPDEIFRGSCRGNCGGGCYLNLHVRDGQLVRTTAADLPDTQYNRICVKGATQVGRVYSANRLLYPMKRVGERGSDDFERISWDEAIDTIVEKWSGYREEFGNNSILVMSGSGNYSLVSGTCNSIGGIQRFVNIINCSFCSNDVDIGTSLGINRAVAGADTHNELTDLVNSKTLINWGANPTISMPQIMHFFMEAKERGTRYIVIDPVFNANSAKADWWIPLRAGTDGALALGVLNVLLDKGWVDESLLKNRTNAGLLIKEDGKFLRMTDLGLEPLEGEPDGEGNPTTLDLCMVVDAASKKPVPFSETTDCVIEGVGEVEGIKVRTCYEDAMSYISQYTPAKVAEICAIKEDDVVELARVYHEDGPVHTHFMKGVNHYRNASYSAWPITLVSILTGNESGEGCSFGMPEEYMPMYRNTNYGAVLPTDSEGNAAAGVMTKLHSVNIQTVLDTGRYEFQDQDCHLKSLYIHGINPVSTMADHAYTTGWISDFEFVVAADVCMTETCKYADIVLPSAYWFEQVDVGYLFSTHPYVMWQDKAIEPLGEAKPDFDIWGLIVEGLGLGDYWCTSEEFIEQALDSDGWKAVGISADSLREKGAQRIYSDDVMVTTLESYNTETGRAQLYQENVVPDHDPECDFDESIEHGLHWETPVYAGYDREYRETYPYHLLSEHMRTHTHTQWWENPLVREYEPEPVLRLNPEDAAELGLEEGDTARAYNDRGSVTMVVALNAGLPRGMVSSGRSWQQEDFIDGHYASLPDYHYNPCVANQEFNDVAVQIEKA